MADDITIKVGFDGKAAQQGLAGLPGAAQQAGQAAAKGLTTPVSQGLDKMQKNAEQWGASLVKRFLGIGAAIALVKSKIDEASQRLDAMAKISTDARKAGLGVEDFQRLTNVSEATGASMDSLAKAFSTISDAVKNAKEGNLEAVDSLAKLGFTQEQVRSGQLSSSAVLFQISQRYKQATTDAQRLAVATGLLGEQGSKLTGVLGMGTMQQQIALNDVLTPANKANQLEAQNQLVERNKITGKGNAFSKMGESISDWWTGRGDAALVARQRFAKRGGATTRTLVGGIGEGEINEAAQSRKAFESIGGFDTSITNKEQRMQMFADMAAEFKAAYTGFQVEGVTQTSEMIDAELKRKFEKLFPETAALDAVKNTESKAMSNLPAAVSSMQAMGGGGGFYTGADSMVGLAEQQLSAAERTAAAVERIANGGGAPPASGVVSSN